MGSDRFGAVSAGEVLDGNEDLILPIWNRKQFWDHVRTTCIGIPVLTSLTAVYNVIANEFSLSEAFFAWVLHSVFMLLFLTPAFWWIYGKISSASDKLSDDESDI
jgi:hypothetical protein